MVHQSYQGQQREARRMKRHPEIYGITARPTREGFESQGERISQEASRTVIIGLADTGAQMVVIAPDALHRMGFREEDMFTYKTRILEANNSSIEIVGSVFVTLEGKDAKSGPPTSLPTTPEISTSYF
jgi:hypothetical protein